MLQKEKQIVHQKDIIRSEEYDFLKERLAVKLDKEPKNNLRLRRLMKRYISN